LRKATSKHTPQIEFFPQREMRTWHRTRDTDKERAAPRSKLSAFAVAERSIGKPTLPAFPASRDHAPCTWKTSLNPNQSRGALMFQRHPPDLLKSR